LLLTILTHIFFFPGVQDEELKYEVGKSMMIIIAIYIIVNIYFFANKALTEFRIWMLRNMSFEMRHDVYLCLGYVHMRWLVFNTYMTKEEREQEKKLK
jgi:hypothetical protein